RFAGQYLDTQTGHYKIGLRYYDPQLARWTQQDPLTGYMDPRRANPYIYAGQDPINQTDPTGAAFEMAARFTGQAVAACALDGAVAGAIGSFSVVGAGPAAAAGCLSGALGATAENVALVIGGQSAANAVASFTGALSVASGARKVSDAFGNLF
ncbi:MAG: RHS repeat-associated core domain-containing protein, partial [Solirubrobacteraceae bacterium MAG38_C4-C5]|nr:RHS repeat-associated core domain-containing protein [Candidatus Siliceabacter maunaloa]